MSWNKNTINLSTLAAVKEVLDDLNQFYIFTVEGEVKGLGLNDSGDKKYQICRLEYGDYVVLEQMLRSDDCDSNNMLVSYKFKKDKVPKRWKIEKNIN